MKIDSSIAAVVTGGASGLGLATVQALRAQGAKVAIFDMNEETGQQAAEATGSVFCQCDVLSDDSVDAAFAAAREANGQERVLVCCAGGGNAIRTAHRDKKTGEIKFFPSDQFEWVLKLNTVGTFRCITRSAAGMMTLDPIDGERGAIVNTSSAAATEGQMGQVAYSAAKAATLAWMRALAVEEAPNGIRSNAVAPASIRTGAWEHRLASNPTVLDKLQCIYPMGRIVTPEEVTNAVLFLASDLASGITGTTLAVDAGLSAGNLPFLDAIR